jgi:peptide-methionine (R)-S-oxide reductase
MTRRELLGGLLALGAAGAARALGLAEGDMDGSQAEAPAGGGAPDRGWEELAVPKARWKEILEPQAYRVLFEEATERAGSSPLLHEKRTGVYVCAACFLPLFRSEWKYESGTGWPSFYDHIEGAIGTKRDFKLFLPRTEYHCARCGGHQGHVFDDGPEPTGLRYCNNGVALRFVPEDEAPPELRRPS